MEKFSITRNINTAAGQIEVTIESRPVYKEKEDDEQKYQMEVSFPHLIQKDAEGIGYKLGLAIDRKIRDRSCTKFYLSKTPKKIEECWDECNKFVKETHPLTKTGTFIESKNVAATA